MVRICVPLSRPNGNDKEYDLDDGDDEDEYVDYVDDDGDNDNNDDEEDGEDLCSPFPPPQR